MLITRSTGALVGTNETTLQNIVAGGTHTGSEVDVLADDASAGEMELYALVAASAVSSVDIRFNKRRVTGQAYQQAAFSRNVATINGTVRVPLGRMSAARFMAADVRNNNGSASVTVFVGYELTKVS
jgi:hypothetical protein